MDNNQYPEIEYDGPDGQEKLYQQIHRSAQESTGGVIWFRVASLRKIAALVGLEYDSLTMDGQYRFRVDCIESVGYPLTYPIRDAQFYLTQ